jgi:hypothetical protein
MLIPQVDTMTNQAAQSVGFKKAPERNWYRPVPLVTSRYRMLLLSGVCW